MKSATPEEIWNHITDAKRILLHCHPNTDGDSVGSALAMAAVLSRRDKKVSIIAGDNVSLPSYLSFLPGYDRIEQKDFFQVDLNEFDLFIILDSGSPSQISRKNPITFPLSIPTIAIDHHVSNTAFADINLIDTDAPATCQILYGLFKEWGINIDHDIALCLFIGMYTDTGSFKFARTSEKTFQAVADLTDKVPEFTNYLFIMENSNSPAWISFMKSAFANTTTWFARNTVAVSTLSYHEMSNLGINSQEFDAGSFANTLKSVIGWEIGMMCIEIKPGETKVSFRTRDAKRFDVSKIAVALGGGGHPAAAAAHLKTPLEAAVAKIQSTIEHIYPELTKS